MIDTGGTIVKAAEALMADGAAGVVIAATHAILSDPAVDRLKNSPATEVIVTEHAADPRPSARFDELTTLSIAPLVSRAHPRGVRGRLRYLHVRTPGRLIRHASGRIVGGRQATTEPRGRNGARRARRGARALTTSRDRRRGPAHGRPGSVAETAARSSRWWRRACQGRARRWRHAAPAASTSGQPVALRRRDLERREGATRGPGSGRPLAAPRGHARGQRQVGVDVRRAQGHLLGIPGPRACASNIRLDTSGPVMTSHAAAFASAVGRRPARGRRRGPRPASRRAPARPRPARRPSRRGRRAGRRPPSADRVEVHPAVGAPLDQPRGEPGGVARGRRQPAGQRDRQLVVVGGRQPGGAGGGDRVDQAGRRRRRGRPAQHGAQRPVEHRGGQRRVPFGGQVARQQVDVPAQRQRAGAARRRRPAPTGPSAPGRRRAWTGAHAPATPCPGRGAVARRSRRGCSAPRPAPPSPAGAAGRPRGRPSALPASLPSARRAVTRNRCGRRPSRTEHGHRRRPGARRRWCRSPSRRSHSSAHRRTSRPEAASSAPTRSSRVALPKRCAVRWAFTPARKSSSPSQVTSWRRQELPLA